MRRTAALLTSSIAALSLVALVAAPSALAKEGLEARLDAPIAMGTPGGTEILVGLLVTVPDENGGAPHPVEGSPIYLRLTGPDGATTRAAAAGDRIPGHYTVRIAIPEGGARDIEVGIHGTSDLAIMVMNDPFAFGPITPRTAQLAPALTTPAPATPAVPVTAPAPASATGTATPPGGPLLAPFAGGLLAIAVLATTGLLVGRRRRGLGTANRSA